MSEELQEKLNETIEKLLTKIGRQLNEEMTSAKLKELADAIYTISKVFDL